MGQWSQTGPWNASGTIADLPFSLFKPFLPPDLTITGAVNGTFRGQGAPNGFVTANVDLRPGPGEVAPPSATARGARSADRAARRSCCRWWTSRAWRRSAARRSSHRLVLLETSRPFDLARGPLSASASSGSRRDDHAVVFTMHHIVSDGWSTSVLMREVVALYGAFSAGRPSPLPPLPIQYPDYAVWQRPWLAGEVLERAARLLARAQLARHRRPRAAGRPAAPAGRDLPRLRATGAPSPRG